MKRDTDRNMWQRSSRRIFWIFGVLALLITVTYAALQISKSKRDADSKKALMERKADNIKQLRQELQEKTAEVQRLKNALEPFRTIALDRYLGTEAEALGKLVKQVNKSKGPGSIETGQDTRFDTELTAEKSEQVARLKEEFALEQTLQITRLKKFLSDLAADDPQLDPMGRILADPGVAYVSEFSESAIQARILMQQKKLDEARELAESLVAKKPDFGLAYFILGTVAMEEGEYSEGKQALRKAIELGLAKDEEAWANNNLAVGYLQKGEIEKAIAHFRESLRLMPDRTPTLNNLAWILATEEDPKFRVGKEAVALAERVCELNGYKNPAYLDTLAAAYAETGRFQEAMEASQKAIDILASSEHQAVVEEMRNRLELYRAGQSYHSR